MMKFSDPKKLAFFSALIIVVFFTIIHITINFLLFEENWLVLMILDVLLFGFIFFVSYYVLENFIYEKIRPIYKTIFSLKAPKGSDARKMDFIDSDTIENVNKQVLKWEQDKKTEIEELKKLAVYRREFLGNVSHELKSPIFNIQGYVMTLLDGGLEDSSINRSYLEKAEKSIDRLVAVVQDLETISQLESGELKMVFVNFNMITLAREVTEFLEMKARKKNITLHFAENYERPITVYADKEKIRQVLINLIDNSIKYGNENGHTKIGFFDMDEHILTEVTDNGIGVPQQDIPRLFERFFRTDKGRSREQGGTGLGLAIVKHIIEAHHQTINVRSNIGVGTTFAFTIKKGR